MRGAPCDMGRLMEVAQRHNLKLIEDVAQADGASYQGRRLGTFGDVAAFSLQYHKVITTGEGGESARTSSRLTSSSRREKAA